jgi:hypothetical protein
MAQHLDTWTAEGVEGGLIRFYQEIAGVGLVFPLAAKPKPIAVDYPDYPVITLHPVEGLEFVEDAVTALGSTTELAHHLFRECWAAATGKHGCPDGGRGSWTSTLITEAHMRRASRCGWSRHRCEVDRDVKNWHPNWHRTARDRGVLAGTRT